MIGVAKPVVEPGPPNVNQTFNGNRSSSILSTLSVYAKIDKALSKMSVSQEDVTMDEPTLFHDQLLATKFFVPSPSHPLIPRPHLTTLLNHGLRHKLTLISAPAGFGKTTLLSAWLQPFPQENPQAPHVAWVSLDEGDNEQVLFWLYALTALDAHQPGLCTRGRTRMPVKSYHKAICYIWKDRDPYQRASGRDLCF